MIKQTKVEGVFPELSYQKESGLEMGDVIQAVLAKCREV